MRPSARPRSRHNKGKYGPSFRRLRTKTSLAWQQPVRDEEQAQDGGADPNRDDDGADRSGLQVGGAYVQQRGAEKANHRETDAAHDGAPEQDRFGVLGPVDEPRHVTGRNDDAEAIQHDDLTDVFRPVAGLPE